MHATFVTLWLQVMQPLANVHETKWTPHVKRESDVAAHIIAVVLLASGLMSFVLSFDVIDAIVSGVVNGSSCR